MTGAEELTEAERMALGFGKWAKQDKGAER